MNVNVAKRCISIYGESGIGKSSLAKVVVNFIQERVKFDGGCIYINAENIPTHGKFIKKLMG